AGIVVHRFGPFELDPANGRLFLGRWRVPLSDTQAAILVQLVSNVGEVVSREALIEAAWGNTAVTENSLRQAIRRLRPGARGWTEWRDPYRDAHRPVSAIAETSQPGE